MPDAPSDSPNRRGLDDLYDIARLADRLGVEHATIRVWLSRKVPWLPQPDGRLNGGAVWRAETLVGVEDRRRPGRPGPKPRTSAVVPLGPIPVAARIVTGAIPVVATATAAAVAVVAAVTGAIPVVRVTTGAIPVVPTPAAPPDGD